ncbi:MAG: site-specific integrase [Xanthomonadales bacterium]|nr:site-specific integrase [Xanthomonadales bacterium]
MKAAPTPKFKQQYDIHLKHLTLQGLRPKTIDAYARAVRDAGAYFDYAIDALSEAQLTDYLHAVMQGRSASTAKHRLYGLRFYYTHVLHKPLPAAKLVRTRAVQRLPNVLSVAEAGRVFAATRVVSYRVLYFTLYSLGLRLGEGLRLEVGDIDAVRQRVHIRDAKGRKDRFVPLPAMTLTVLRRFWQLHRHPTLLFPSRQGGAQAAARATSHLDRGGVQVALRKVVAECGLKKRLPHTACATAMPRT